MTKSEIDFFDIALIGPMMLFLNQYFDIIITEKYLLYASLVSEKFLSITRNKDCNLFLFSVGFRYIWAMSLFKESLPRNLRFAQHPSFQNRRS